MPLCGKNENLPAIKSLATLFEAAVLSRPNKIALIDIKTEETVTFLELSARSNQFARFLLKECIASLKTTVSYNLDGDNIVAICIPPSIDLIVIIFALLKINCVYLPIDIDFPSSRVDHIICDAKPLLLLTKSSPPATNHLKNNNSIKLFQLENISGEVRKEDFGSLTEEERNEFFPKELLTAVLYTSGSTGIPKGVRLPQKATLNRLIWQWRHFPYSSEEVCCFKTALTFVDSISEIFGPILTGHSVVVIPKVMTLEVESLINVLEKYSVGRILLVPSLLSSILLHASRQKEPTLECVRLWVCSGEVFPTGLLKSFFNVFSKEQSICNFYGSTEVLGDVTSVQFKNFIDVEQLLFENKVPLGMPISNCQIYLMDASLENEVDEGKIGEICVTGENLSCGYVGKVQPEKFIRNPISNSESDLLYRTGDLGRNIKGQLHYAGRIDSQMKIRGHRVDLNEVEMALQSVDGVEKCQVICYKPGEVEQALLGFFTSESLTIKKLQVELSSLLLNYMIPQCILVTEIPLLVNGKVDRQSLLSSYEKKALDLKKNREFDISNCEKDKEELAMILLKVVAKVLGPTAPDKLSLEMNFFDIGGNSLNSISTITSLHDAGYYIGISDFLKANNFAEVLLRLKDMKTKESSSYRKHEEDLLKSGGRGIYKILPVTEKMKDEVIGIISKSFVEKEVMTSFLRVTVDEFSYTMQHMFPDVLEQDLSFVACREDTGEISAVTMNHDMHKALTLKCISQDLRNIFDYLDFCEEAVSDQLPSGQGQVFHPLILAVESSILPNEKVMLAELMEQEVVELAKQRGFSALLTVNTSPLTKHLCEDVIGYKPLRSFQFNKFVKEDGSKPFEQAPDDITITTAAYYLSN